MMADQIKTKTEGAAGSQATEAAKSAPISNRGKASSNKFKIRTINGKAVPVFEGSAAYNTPASNTGKAPTRAPRNLDVADLVDVQRYNESKARGSVKYTPYIPMAQATTSAPVENASVSTAPAQAENVAPAQAENVAPAQAESVAPVECDGGAEYGDFAGEDVYAPSAYDAHVAAEMAAATLVADSRADRRDRKNRKNDAAIAQADAYASREDVRRARADALLADGKRDAQDRKAAKKAKHMEQADAVVVETMESYSDVEVYEPTVETPVVKTPEVKGAPAKENFSTEAYDNHLDNKARKAEKKSERAARRSEQMAFAGAFAVAASTKAESAPAPAPAPASYTDGPFGEGYDADYIMNAKAEAAKAAAVAHNERALMRDAAKRDAIEQRNIKSQAKYENATDKDAYASATKTDLLSHAKADKQERKIRKASKKAEAKAEKAATATAVVPVVVFADHTELFDRSAYDAHKQSIAKAEAEAKAEAVAMKADAKAAKSANAEAKRTTAYEKHETARTERSDKKGEMLAANKQAVSERRVRKAGIKEAKAKEKAESKAAVVVVPTFGDYTELFDRSAYDAHKQSIAKAEAEVKAEAVAMKVDAKAAKSANAEAKRTTAYEKHETARTERSDRKGEMLSANKQAVSDRKVRKAGIKEAKAAAKAESKAAVVVVPTFDDYTELFDKSAYEADKQAIATAEAEAKAEAVAMKADARFAKRSDKDAKRTAAYDKHEIKSDRNTDMLAANKQRISDKIARKTSAQADNEINFAPAAIVLPAPEFVDAPAAFNQAEYDAARKAIADNDARARANATIAAIESKRRKTLDKNEKDIKSTEKLESKLMKGEMIGYAKDYKSDVKRNRLQLKRSEKYGKFMLEYGSTYDPEWDGEFNNYGLPETDPLTEGVKLAPSRVRTPKKEKLSGFNLSKLNSLSRMQRDTDNKMVAARVYSQFADLELEVAQAEQDFSGEFNSGKEKRWIRDTKKELKQLKTKVAMAEKYERLDNERYYSVVSTNFDTVDLPRKADRDTLRAMREELMRLLDVRDDINAQLLLLYTGSEKGDGINHINRRNKAVLKARKRAYVKYSKYCNALNKHRATRNEKMRIFDKLDEIVELSGEIARIKYILRKEKPIGKGRREYVREKGNAKSNLRYAKRYVERATAKAIRKAKKRQRRQRATIATLVILALLAGLVGVGYFMGPEILEAIRPMVPADFQQHIDNLLGMWPR